MMEDDDINNRQEENLQSKNKEELLQKIRFLMEENQHLKNRLVQYQPQKNKKLRPPNQSKIKTLFQTFQTKKYALKVCYIGTNYDGMAYQKATDNNTIQAYILKAMHTMSLIKNINVEDTDYTRAGRTDKGVSAMGNVIALKMRTSKMKKQQQNDEQKKVKEIEYCSMLNAILPDDIRIIGCEQVGDDFNARYWCTRRSYKYFFPKNNLNIEAMKEGIKHFVGTHNFTNFCKMNLTNTVNFVRTIFSAQIIKSQINQVFQDDRNEIYYFYFIGNSFLWHQIRFMSSVLFLIGSGQENSSLVSDLLNLDKYPKKPNYPMAPDYALILQDCLYDQVQFEAKPDVITSFYNTFNEMVMRKSTEKTLILNCMMIAQKELIVCAKMSKEAFLEETKQKQKKSVKRGRKKLEMLKSSGRGLDEAIESLKGKKLEIYKKKIFKQKEYETRKKEEQQEEKVMVEKNEENQQKEFKESEKEREGIIHD